MRKITTGYKWYKSKEKISIPDVDRNNSDLTTSSYLQTSFCSSLEIQNKIIKMQLRLNRSKSKAWYYELCRCICGASPTCRQSFLYVLCMHFVKDCRKGTAHLYLHVFSSQTEALDISLNHICKFEYSNKFMALW